MNHPSDTPPNGDFAKYVEQLSNRSAAARPPFDGSAGSTSQGQSTFAASAGIPSGGEPAWPAAMPSFGSHVKWAVVLWIASQALDVWVPGLGYAFIPFLGVYIGWVIFRFAQRSPNGLTATARARAEAAIAELARKAKAHKSAESFAEPVHPQKSRHEN